MIIKTYTAESASAALKLARADMGGEAMVLKTKQLADTRGIQQVELTACVDKMTAAKATQTLVPRLQEIVVKTSKESTAMIAPESSPSKGFTDAKRWMSDVNAKLDSILSVVAPTPSPASTPWNVEPNIIQQMRDADVPREVIASLIAQTADNSVSSDEALNNALRKTIENFLSKDITLRLGDTVMVVGPSGSGKTSVIGKLAAELISRDKLAVSFLSIDTAKIAAQEEIHAYADLLRARVLSSGSTFKPSDSSVTFIDTPGFGKNAESISALRKQIELYRPSVCLLVFSATTRTADLMDILTQTKALNVTHLVMTMTDQTSRWGNWLGASLISRQKLLYISNSPSGRGELVRPTIDMMTSTIIAHEVAHV
ncbi:MAG: GTPase [candidate division Zixibacteria bacterium]|nr:GTPase [candidate division Zixibacteria bacterium]